MPTPNRRRPGSSGQPNRRRRVAGHARPGTEKEQRPSPSPRPRATDEDGTPVEQPQDAESAADSAADSATESTTGEAGGPAEQAGAAVPETGSTEPEQAGAGTEELDEGSIADRPEAGAQPSAHASTEAGDAAVTGAVERTGDGGDSDGGDSDASGHAGAPADEDVPGWSVGDGGGDGDGSGEAARRGVSPKVLAAVLTVAGVVLAGLAGFFGYQYSQVSGATSNKALVDASATAKVKEDIGSAVERVLSYDHSAIEETEKAADELLITEDVRETYNDLYSEVKRIAPEQKMVLKTRVSRSAVIELDDDRARLLVFVDQSANREGQEDGNVGGSQLAVTAQRQDGQWKIAQLDTYTDGDGNIGQPGAGEESGDGEDTDGEQGSDEGQDTEGEQGSQDEQGN
ncbi:hypothetical protein H0B56_04050 [Haloechinothrix sp. YIM 98757]|uniref:Mce-associated membrane protein n=1 Tax=Haloechinothrix aidingensis TaxID=2752311 RepID=A0A837ZVN0_9PSEU|nr:hypothetical protein [Haloechinothrix aidingensis]MBA0124706.1 hypothetical protein [Haloechinothrix aidingensis]